jgi:hypothetical protein
MRRWIRTNGMANGSRMLPLPSGRNFIIRLPNRQSKTVNNSCHSIIRKIRVEEQPAAPAALYPKKPECAKNEAKRRQYVPDFRAGSKLRG